MHDELEAYCIKFQTNVIGYEYKGYGISHGNCTPENVKEDISIVYRFLNEVLKVPKKNIIIFGRSIGTGPSLYLAHNLDGGVDDTIGGLILQSPFTSIRDLAKDLVGGFLSSIFVGKIFDNFRHIETVNCPTLVIHGTEDNVIPFDMGIQVFDNSPSKLKKFIKCKGSDHNTWDTELDIYRPIKNFFKDYLPDQDYKQTIKGIEKNLYFNQYPENDNTIDNKNYKDMVIDDSE